jgi:nitrogen fixation/metabolism regulation signal transduction histidine kinase
LRSIASKFNLLTIFLIALTAVLTAGYIIWQHQLSAYSNFTEHGEEIATMLSKDIVYGIYTENQEAIGQSLQSLEGNKDIAYIQVYNNKKEILTQKNQHGLSKLPPLASGNAFVAQAQSSEFIDPKGKAYINIVAPVYIKAGMPGTDLDQDFTIGQSQVANNAEIIGTIQLGISQNSILNNTRKFVFQTLLIAPFTIVLGIFLTSWQTRRITQPIKSLVSAIHDIAKGDFGKDLTISTKTDEIAELAHSFNKMSKDLALYEKQVSSHREILEEEVIQRTLD